MKTMIATALAASALAMPMFAAETGGAAAGETETAPKSIVPNKYAGKYKGGGSDPAAEFIKEKTYDKGAVVLSSLYALCRQNLEGTLTEEQVAKFEAQTEVEKPAQGAAGRARMTLGNMLRARARKNGGLKDLNGEFVAIEGLEKPAVSGAAAKAQENAGNSTEDADEAGDETGTVETVEEDGTE